MPFDIKTESEFIQACVDNKIEVVEKLLKQDPTLVNTPASNGSYPLMFVAQNGNLPLTDLLLKLGAKIDEGIKVAFQLQTLLSGTTPLWLAACNKHWEVVELLLNAGASNLDASPIQGPERGITVLWFASFHKQWGVVKLLLGKEIRNLEPSPSTPAVDQGITPLWIASAYKQWEVVKLLLEKGVHNHLDVSPIEEGENKNRTPLFWTFLARNDEIFRLLLNKGISLFLPDHPIINLLCLQQLLIHNDLHNTENHKLIENSELTTTFNASKTLFTIANSTPETITPKIKKTLKNVLAILCQSEPALNGRFDGKTALHAAIEKENLCVIEELVINGADLFLPDHQNQTAESLSPLPIVQAFASLKMLRDPVDQLQKLSMSNIESKHNTENLVKEIERLKNIILGFSEALKPEYKNKLCYELGKLLENALPYISMSIVVEAFSKVSAESSELYNEARAQLLHYKIVNRKVAHTQSLDESSDDDSENATSKLALAFQARSAIAPCLLSRVLIEGVLGKKSSHGKGFGLVRQTDTLYEGLTKTLQFLQTAVAPKAQKNKAPRRIECNRSTKKRARTTEVNASAVPLLPQYLEHVSHALKPTTLEQVTTSPGLS
ncbi:MAG TPA: ankyrin repeat domain-containing protein [Gammaproteobacteria bacterium]|nr:ankyrin repeat domain-containing protein [Gammaproteobacteria bacterium]